MAAPAPAPIPTQEPEAKIARNADLVYKLIGIAVVLASLVVWLASTNSTARDAKELSEKNAEKLEQKADKQEIQPQLQRIYNKLDELDRYLRDHK